MPPSIDIRAYNREAWNRQVENGQNPWTIPVTAEVIARARQGQFSVLLTENVPVPADWFPPLKGLEVLALACGGGQQAPVFAAAGARVTVFDNSPAQLGRDREVAGRENLPLTLVEGDMRDLSIFDNESFDFIFHPVSNLFINDVRPVWKEAFRVLRPGGTLLSGFMNPIFYLFDSFLAERESILEVKYKLPYADYNHPEVRQLVMEQGWPLEHSHSLTDQLGGQMAAGFHLIGLYEDCHAKNIIGDYTPTYLATRALKPK
jgi:ubiquinone/menaquinone biosynthesis C-methylase UbiE